MSSSAPDPQYRPEAEAPWADVLDLSAQSPQEAPAQSARPSAPGMRRHRGWKLAAVLFVLTCLSTLWSGSFSRSRLELTPWINWGVADVVMVLVSHWDYGAQYTLAIMSILLAHELGHFFTAMKHRVPASLPYFIPMPFSPFGTMGAVILMQGRQADRRQLFDVGLAGPLAGLVVCVPVLIWGVEQAHADYQPAIVFHHPLLLQVLIQWLRPELAGEPLVMNPLLMAGWLGLLITGLNMLPISQLDGGHVCYALLGHRSYWVARALFAAAVIFMILTQRYFWMMLLILLLLLGVKHPPTRNDQAPLGSLRQALGWASLLIPVVCFNPWGVTVRGLP